MLPFRKLQLRPLSITAANGSPAASMHVSGAPCWSALPMTPFYDSARALLAAGLAKPDDVITMRHAGMHHTVLASVGRAAKLAETQPPGHVRLRSR
jgi:hypothetical protein